MIPRARMILIIDENVPQTVAEFFRGRGHSVIPIRDFLGRGAPDAAIARFSDEAMAVVVTWDRDFKQIVRRAPTGRRTEFRRLGRISFSCRESNGLRRTERLIDYIEFAFERAQSDRDQRLIVEITESSFRVVR